MCSFYYSAFTAVAQTNARQAQAHQEWTQQRGAVAPLSELREMAARQAPRNCEGCGAALVRARCDYCGRPA